MISYSSPRVLAKLTTVLLLTSLTWSLAKDALPTDPAPDKVFKLTISQRYEKMVAAVAKNPPKQGSIICIGSSQMEKWKTIATDLAPLTIYNYGIGGSRMAQAADTFVTGLAIPFKPRAIILYEGSNDLAGGVAPEEIKKAFQRFYTQVREALPETRIYVLGLVPSPGKRFEKFTEFKKTNALLKAECESHSKMTFIDTTTPLLATDGTPRMECFIPGDIHMTAEGYKTWKEAIAPVVLPIETPLEK